MSGSSRRMRRRAEEVEDNTPEVAPPAPARPAQQASPDVPVSTHQLSYLQAAGGNAMVLRLLHDGPGEAAGDELAGRIQARLGGGESLAEDVRDRFSPGLGTPLTDVRVHRDREAADLAGSVGAKAFTTGSDVFFGAGQYAPGTPDGAHLIAHELVHTTQRAAAAPSRGLEVSNPTDISEMSAESGARALVAGHRLAPTDHEHADHEQASPAVQRSADQQDSPAVQHSTGQQSNTAVQRASGQQSNTAVQRTPDDHAPATPAAPGTAPAPAPAPPDISWIDGLPAYLQEQIDMFKQATLDKATGDKEQKLRDQRTQNRETFMTVMMRYLGTEDQVRAHFEAIHSIDVGGGGDQLWVHDSTRERLMAVKADLEAKSIPMPATTVGQNLRGRHLHDTGGAAGMMTHGLGFACDWKAYAAPHIKDKRLHTLFETIEGGPASFHLEVGGKALGHEQRRDLIEQMGQGTADPEKARQLLDSVTSEYTRLKGASDDFKTSLPESSLSKLREVERRRTEVDQLARRLKRAGAKDKPALQAQLAEAQRAFDAAIKEVQANQTAIFQPWLDAIAKRGAEIEKVAADKGVDLRGEVTTAGTMKELEQQAATLTKGVKKIEKDAGKLLTDVRSTRQALLNEVAAIEAGLPDDSPDRTKLLAVAQELMTSSDGLELDAGDLLPEHKPAKYAPGRGRKRTVEAFNQVLDRVRDQLGRQREQFTEIDAPLRDARTQRQASADDIAARKEHNAGVSTKVGKDGLARLQADRTTLFWLDQTAKALSSNIDFVLKSRDVADPGITQLLGMMSGTEGGGYFTPDAETGGESEAAQGKWSGTHGYNLEFFKSMVQHGFELGVAWDGFADTMHFELVEGRRLAYSGGSRPLVAGSHQH